MNKCLTPMNVNPKLAVSERSGLSRAQREVRFQPETDRNVSKAVKADGSLCRKFLGLCNELDLNLGFTSGKPMAILYKGGLGVEVGIQQQLP